MASIRFRGWLLLRYLLFSAISATMLIWLGGFFLFSAQLPQQTKVPPLVSDAIVVLTGGAGRLQLGLKLLSHGKGEFLLISGVEPGTTTEVLRSGLNVDLEKFNCCVELGYKARDTWGNAMETALWAERNGYRSLHLVTASYHMPRSIFMFRYAMPEIILRANPVFPSHVKLNNWWVYPGTMKLLAVEYSKYLISLLRLRLIGPEW